MYMKASIAGAVLAATLLAPPAGAADTLLKIADFPEDYVGQEYTFTAGYGAGDKDAGRWDWDGENGWWIVLRNRARKHVTNPGPDHYSHTEGELIVVISKELAKKDVVPLGRNYLPDAKVTFKVTKKTVDGEDYFLGVVSEIDSD